MKKKMSKVMSMSISLKYPTENVLHRPLVSPRRFPVETMASPSFAVVYCCRCCGSSRKKEDVMFLSQTITEDQDASKNGRNQRMKVKANDGRGG